MNDLKPFSSVLALLLCLSPGCSKATPEDTPTPPPAQRDSGKFTPPPPEANSTQAKGDAVADAYEKAAARFSSFQAASPGERYAILRDALPALEAALKASDARLSTDPKALNFRTVSKLDARLSEAFVWREFRTVVSSGRAPDRGALPINSVVVYTNIEPREKVSEPVATGASPGRVQQLTPRNVGKAIAIGAEITKKSYDDLAFGNAVQSLLEASAKRKDYTEILKLSLSDSTETREQKIVARAALDAFLGSIISHKGSFFLAAERQGGGLEVWEFKSPIGIDIRREPTDQKTRLNSGVEFTIKVEFSHDEPSDLCRRYVGGFWGPWGEFPKIGELEISRDENWTVEFKSDLPFRSFHKLTLAEIELALLRSGTTKTIAAALKRFEANPETPDAKLTLLPFFTAHGDYEKLREIAASFLEAEELELPTAKRIATALLTELAATRPAMAESVKSGVAFKHYEKLKGLNPEIGEMQQLPYPRRLQKGHFYGEGFDLSPCIKAFEILTKVDPTDADALFDLAVLELFGTERFQKPRETGNDLLEKASALHLSEAVALAAKSPPKSGRNFAKLITEEPTFIVLCGQEQFESLLHKLFGGDRRRAPITYEKRFERQISYLNAGY